MITFNWPSTSSFKLTEENKTNLECIIIYNSEQSQQLFDRYPKLVALRLNQDLSIDPFFFNEPKKPSISNRFYGANEQKDGTKPCRKIIWLRNDVLIDTNKLLGLGGQTHVYQYYSPITKKFVAFKNLPKGRKMQNAAKYTYTKLMGLPGCVSAVSLADTCVFEPCYTKTLKEALIKNTFQTTTQKISALGNLLVGVRSIHDQKVRDRVVKQDRVETVEYAMSHRDLKPENIFIDENGLFYIGDYGYVCSTRNVVYSSNYSSPESSTISLSTSSKKEKQQFNHRLGQKHDIWQLGLIFSAILENKLYRASAPPLSFSTSAANKGILEEATSISNLTQPQIIGDIQKKISEILKSSLPQPEKIALTTCWKVIESMLQVNPNSRPSVGVIAEKVHLIQKQIMIRFKWPSATPFGLETKERKGIENTILYNVQIIQRLFNENSKLVAIASIHDLNISPFFLDATETTDIKQKLYGTEGRLGESPPKFQIIWLRDETLITTNKILGTGGQTKVYQLYSPISEKFFAFKCLPLDESERRTAIMVYKKLSGLPGCVPSVCLADTAAFEPCYPKTLKEALNEKLFHSTAKKIDALKGLLKGIISIHQSRAADIVINNSTTRRTGYMMSHRDLKPANIFIDESGLCFIGDYGYVGATHQLVHSPNYLSPELANKKLKEPLAYERKNFNHKWGQKIDIWQLGLIFSAILENKLYGSNTPPLDFSKNISHKGLFKEPKSVSRLKQQQIYRDTAKRIVRISKSHLPKSEKKALIACWRIVASMLQVKASSRPSIGTVAENLEKLSAGT